MMNRFSSDGLSKSARSGRLAAVAAALRSGAAGWGARDRTQAPTRRTPLTIDGISGEADVQSGPAPQPTTGPDWLNFVPQEVRGLVASHLPAGLPDYLGEAASGFNLPASTFAHQGPPPAERDLPVGAQFLSRTFSNAAGSRPYKLYVPS